MTQVLTNFSPKISHVLRHLMRWAQLSFLASLVFIVTLPQTHAAEIEEYDAKALLVYNFIKSTSWPEGSFKEKKSPIEVAILGDIELFNSFKKYDEKRIKGRALKMVQLDTVNDFNSQHVLYFTGEWTPLMRVFIQELSSTRSPVLTVGESEDFAINGGIISIIREDNHLALITNPNTAKKSNLFLSRNLIKLSRQVSTSKDKQSR